MEQNLVRNMADILMCDVVKLPLSYLGLYVGVDHTKFASSKSSVERVRGRLANGTIKTSLLGVELP